MGCRLAECRGAVPFGLDLIESEAIATTLHRRVAPKGNGKANDHVTWIIPASHSETKFYNQELETR